MKNEYSPKGQKQIGYYDACRAIERLKEKELEACRAYMGNNPGDAERRRKSVITISAYIDALSALHELTV